MSLLPQPSPVSKLPQPKSVSFASARKRPQNQNDAPSLAPPAKSSKGLSPGASLTAARRIKRKSINHLKSKPPVINTKKPPAPQPATRRPLAGRNAPPVVSQPRVRVASASSVYSRLTSHTVSSQSKSRSSTDEVRSARSSMESVDRRFSTLENRLAKLEMEKEEAQLALVDSKQQKEKEINQLSRDNSEWETRYEQVLGEKLTAERTIENIRTEKLKISNEKQELQFRVDQLDRQVNSLTAELSSAQTHVTTLTSHTMRHEAENAVLKDANSQLKLETESQAAIILRLEKQLKETLEESVAMKIRTENEFRRMHNAILDLKGNIRVMCRVRPLLSSEPGFGQLPSHLSFPDKSAAAKKIALAENKTSSSTNSSRPSFEFDRVFNPNASQEEIFEQVKELVTSAIHGYNVSILAYGQTGSGKTYTMEGMQEEGQVGLIPRAVKHLFDTAQTLQPIGWEYKFTLSILQIYNEEVNDLLGKDIDRNLKILDNNDNPKVPELEEHTVAAPAQVMSLLKRASKNRIVAATKCNEKSSRSHLLFIMDVARKEPESEEIVHSTLTLVDLCGSERLKESGAEGDRKTETCNINKSLSALERVINSRLNAKPKSNKSHFPYRDSNLTWLLKSSLGAGRSKTLMIATVSPLLQQENETKRTLDFASKASKCHIGAARKA